MKNPELKKELVTEFENFCVSTDLKNFLQRKEAVMYQNQRNIWQIISGKFGYIRILDLSSCCYIQSYPIAGCLTSEPEMLKIQRREFNRLKKLYFGDFKEDIEQLVYTQNEIANSFNQTKSSIKTPEEMNRLKELFESVKTNPKAFRYLKNSVICCQQYETASWLHDLERELFPKTEESKIANKEAELMMVALRSVHLKAESKKTAWMLYKLAILTQKNKGNATIQQTTEIQLQAQTFFPEEL